MLLGKVIALAALREGRQLSWIPSYGAAMRGGTAYCMVIISDEKIASAYTDKCDTLFAFNLPSWKKFQPRLRNAGLILLNSTLAEGISRPKGIKLLKAPFTRIASELGDLRTANMVALGAYLAEKRILKRASVLEVFKEIAPGNKPHLLRINQKALDKGYNLV